jgi:hypothetical protein
VTGASFANQFLYGRMIFADRKDEGYFGAETRPVSLFYK